MQISSGAKAQESDIPTTAELLSELGITDLLEADEGNPYADDEEVLGGDALIDPISDPYSADGPMDDTQVTPLEINALSAVSLEPDTIPVRIFLDDKLLTETVNDEAVLAADQQQAEVSTDVMDVHLNVSAKKPKRRMSVKLIRNNDPETPLHVRQRVGFSANWNYDAFISKAEIRLYRLGGEGRGKPIQVLPVDRNATRFLRLTPKIEEKIGFALRLYGKDGGFDQSALTKFSDEKLAAAGGLALRAKSSLSETGIELYGAQVNFDVKQVPKGHKVFVMGAPVFVSGGMAKADLIYPPGEHRVKVSVLNEDGKGLHFERRAIVPKNDFFYAALGDITLGANTGKSYIDYYQTENAGGELDLFESAGLEGQASMFLKGRVLGKYLITAALDTGEGELGTLFDNIVSRDPNAALSQIDVDETYSVYGDYSTVRNEAPTQEKLYVKIERGGSHLLWGSFKTSYRGNTFATIERSLYGAELRISKRFQTDAGSAQLETTAFAVPPGQLQQREQLRGNNGFVYALDKSNILPNSEIIRVEIRHPTTNALVEQRDLFYGRDYDIDYLQGQVVLAKSLPANRSWGSVLDKDHAVYLVVIYEFTPSATSTQQVVVGGRSELVVGDFLSVGATGLFDGSGPVDQHMLGLDAQINVGEGSYLKGQVAQTSTIDQEDAVLQTEILSSNGYADITAENAELNKANAWKAEVGLMLDDIGINSPGSSLNASIEHRDAHFAAPGQGTISAENAFDVDLFVPLVDGKLRLEAEVSSTEDLTYEEIYRTARVGAEYDVTEKLTGSLGAEHLYDSDKGERTDVGAGLSYKPNEKLKVGAFGSTTVKVSPTTLERQKVGLEFEYKATDKLDFKGSAATGTGGFDARVEAGYTFLPGQRSYASYEIGSDPGGMFSLNPASGPRQGLFKLGTKYDLSPELNVYAEGAVKHQKTDIISYTQTAGISYAPNQAWRFGLRGRMVMDEDLDGKVGIDSFDGTASANYVGEKVKAGTSATMSRKRDLFGDGNDDKFETSSYLRFDYDPNWKLNASLNTVLVRSVDEEDNANYVTADISAAYRPVDNDRFLSVFSYKAMFDLPSNGSSTNVSNTSYKQRSHILSADASYAFTPNFTLGAKYGLKWGQVTSNRDTNDWKSSTVHLLTTRADFNFARKWDAVLEGRMMHISEGNSTRYGALAAIYRHFGKNLKVGVGHSYSSVSDDLTNIDAVSDGFFINVISKF